MICRSCIRSAASTALRRRPAAGVALARPLSTSLPRRGKTDAAPASAVASPVPPPDAPNPVFKAPLSDKGTDDAAAEAEAELQQPLSACATGTILSGLNYFKNQSDPVAMADNKYPAWLWRCLDVQKKAADDDAEEGGDEFSKSKKQRRIAAKRQRALEARLVAEGNLEALAPKIPMQQQSINLPANAEGTTAGALAAAEAREALRQAMRKERKAKIKEDNYLKSM